MKIYPAYPLLILGAVLTILALVGIVVPPLGLLGIMLCMSQFDAILFGLVLCWISPAPNPKSGSQIFNLHEKQWIKELLSNGGFSDQWYESAKLSYRVVQKVINTSLGVAAIYLGGIEFGVLWLAVIIFGIHDYWYHIGLGNIPLPTVSDLRPWELESPWMWWTGYGIIRTLFKAPIWRSSVIIQAWIGMALIIAYFILQYAGVSLY